MKVESIDPESDGRWDEFVTRHPRGSIYHLSAWMKVIASTFGHKPRCYALVDQDTGLLGGIVPFMIVSNLLTGKRLVSLPFTSYCDPLLPEGRLGEVIEHALRENPSLGGIELKFRGDFGEDLQGFEKVGEFVDHTVDMRGDLDSLYRSFHKSSVRQRIERAGRNGFKLRFSQSEEDLEKIYGLLVPMRKRKGLPPHPHAFLDNVWKILRSQHLVFAPLVEHENQTVAAAIVLKFKNTIYFEYSASDPLFQKNGANPFLIWEIMKFGHGEGAEDFDFGRSALENNSLIEFKERWGGKGVGLSYCNYPKGKGISFRNGVVAEAGKYVNSRLPTPLLRLEGELLYRYLG